MGNFLAEWLRGLRRRAHRRELPAYARPLGRENLTRITVPGSPECWFDLIILGGRIRGVAPESPDDDPQDSSMPNVRRFLLFAQYVPALFADFPEARRVFADYRALVGDRGWHHLESAENIWPVEPSPFGAIFASRRR